MPIRGEQKISTAILVRLISQWISCIWGNYATQESSGMCHLMSRRHLSEWREEDEQAFAHSSSSGLNHAITSESTTELSKVSSITL